MPSSRHKTRHKDFPGNLLTTLKFFSLQISVWGANRHRDSGRGTRYHYKEPRHLRRHESRERAVGVPPPPSSNKILEPDGAGLRDVSSRSGDHLDNPRYHDTPELSEDDDGSDDSGGEDVGQRPEEDSDEDQDEYSDSESEDDSDAESEDDTDAPIEVLSSAVFSETGIVLPTSPPELSEGDSIYSDATPETNDDKPHILPVHSWQHLKSPLQSIPPEAREGYIAKVSFKKCGPGCQYYARDYKVRAQHRWQKHRGEKHALAIVQANQDDIRGYTCTSLGQRKKLAENRLNSDYLRLEGGNNEFWGSIKRGPDGETRRVPSKEKPQLFIQGDDRMPEATYVEISEMKSFPVDRFRLFHGKLLRLTPESLEFLRNATARDGREMPTAGVPVRPAGNTHEERI